MEAPVKIKSPNEVIPLTVDYSDLLGADTIPVTSPPSSAWELDGNSPQHLSQASATHSTNSVQMSLGGGQAGSNYLVTNRIVTASGKRYERSFRIYVRSEA